ncbi:hypothetical protein MMC28_002157 [Mycoblastus sanguinarius]|nr:hypothetical protein [Mycoblastus sanguinarius]
MGTFTKACLAPTMPNLSSLPSIGSVAAMYERTNAETAATADYAIFLLENDPNARLILQMNGQTNLDDYIEEIAASRQLEQREAVWGLGRRSACRVAMLRFLEVEGKVKHKLRKISTSAGSKVTHLHVTQSSIHPNH